MVSVQNISTDLLSRNYSSVTVRQYSRLMLNYLSFCKNKQYKLSDVSAALFVGVQKNNMRNNAIAALRQYFIYNRIEFDFSNQRFKRMRSSKPILSRTEAFSYMSYSRVHFASLFPVLVLLYGSGLRISEAVQLHTRDILNQKATIRAKGSQRLIPISDKLIPYIPENGYLFKGAFSLDYYIRQYQEKISLCSKEMNLHHVSAHTFRHTFAVHFLVKGYTLKHLQKLLGHKSIKSTEIYLNYIDISKVKALY